MSTNLRQQIEEVQYELRMRAQVYPRSRKMREGEKAQHVARMEAVLRTLKWLAGNDVPADLPRPGDLLVALIHIRQLSTLHGTRPPQEPPLELIEHVRKCVEDVLTGVPLPKLEGPPPAPVPQTVEVPIRGKKRKDAL